MAQRLHRCLPLVAAEPAAAAAIAAAAAGGAGAPASGAAITAAGKGAAAAAAAVGVGASASSSSSSAPLLAAAAARWAGNAAALFSAPHRAYASAAAASAAATAATAAKGSKKAAAPSAAASTAANAAGTLVDGRGKRPRGVGGGSGSSSSPRTTSSRSRSPAAAGGAGARRKAAAAGDGAAASPSSSPPSSSSSRLYTRENYERLAASGWSPALVASVAAESAASPPGASNATPSQLQQRRVYALMARIRASGTIAELQAAVAAGEAASALDPVAVAAAVTRVPRLLAATAQGEQAQREREFALALMPQQQEQQGGGGRRRPGKRPDALLEQQARELRASGALPPEATADDVAAARAAAAAAARRTAALAAGRLLDRLYPSLERALPELGAREVSNCLWAVSRAPGHTPPARLVQAAAAALLRPASEAGQGTQVIDAASAQELVMLSQAARRLAPTDDALWSAIERRGADVARASAAAISSAASSFSSSSSSAEAAPDDPKHQQQQQQRLMGWYEASSLAWAVCQAGRRAPALAEALAEWVSAASSSSASIGSLPPPRVREVTALLWALAEQAPRPASSSSPSAEAAAAADDSERAAAPASAEAPAVEALCDSIAARLPEIEAPGDLASVLWAVGRLGHLHPPLLRRVAEHLLRTPLAADRSGEQSGRASSPALETSGGVSWRPLPGTTAAPAATGPPPTARLLAMASWAAARLLPGSLADMAPAGGEGGVAAAPSGTEGEQQQQQQTLEQAAAAGAAAPSSNAETAAAAAAAAAEGAATSTPSAATPPSPSPHAPLAAALLLPAANALLRSPDLFSPQDAAGVAWAAARLGHRSPSWWRQAAERAVLPRLAEFGAPQLTNVARAYARQGAGAGAAASAQPQGLMEGIARAAEARAGEFGAADAAGLLRALVAGGGGPEVEGAIKRAAEALVAALAARQQDVSPRERRLLATAATAAGVADAGARLGVVGAEAP